MLKKRKKVGKKEGAAETATERMFSDAKSIVWIATVLDVFSIVVSMVDVVSDGAVAYQFYSNGHMGWFYAVLCSLVISNCAYTFWALNNPDCKPVVQKYFPYFVSGRHKVLRYVAFFPFAQLAPTYIWLVRKFDRQFQSSEKAPSGRSSLVQTSESLLDSALAKEELQAIEGSKQVIRRMYAGWDKHIETHAMFYVETVVEAIPQSVIQLLACTYIGDEGDGGGSISSVQLFSLSLSLISMLSKAYVISHSSDLKVFCFKFFCAAFDLFSLFFVFSTVVSNDREQSVPFPLWGFFGLVGDEFLVSGLTRNWSVKLLIQVTAAVAGYLAVMYNTMQHGRSPLKPPVWVLFLALMLIPFSFCLEGIKLSWIIFVLWLLEPEVDAAEVGNVLALRTFVNNARTAKERDHRVFHVYSCCATRLRKSREYVEAHKLNVILEAKRWDSSIGSGPEAEGSGSLERPFTGLDVFDAVTCAGKSYTTTFISWLRRQKKDHHTGKDKFSCWCSMAVHFPCVLLFGLWHPLVNYFFYGHQHNSFQTFCFVALLLCLVPLALLLPSVATFVYSSLALRELERLRKEHPRLPHFEEDTRGEIVEVDKPFSDLWWQRKRVEWAVEIQEWIASFHKPTNLQILSATIPTQTLINHDLVSRLDDFLEKGQLTESGMSLAECRSVTEEVS